MYFKYLLMLCCWALQDKKWRVIFFFFFFTRLLTFYCLILLKDMWTAKGQGTSNHSKPREDMETGEGDRTDHSMPP